MNKQQIEKQIKDYEEERAEALEKIKAYQGDIMEFNQKIEGLKEELNKPVSWEDELNGILDPQKEGYYFIQSAKITGFQVGGNQNIHGLTHRPAKYTFKNEESAELLKEKMLLMQEMHAFAHVRNEGWVADWGKFNQPKYGATFIDGGLWVRERSEYNSLVFGIALKSPEIAVEMIEFFGERIQAIYNQQY